MASIQTRLSPRARAMEDIMARVGRRDLLVGGAAIAASAWLPRGAAGQPTVLRRSVGGMAANDPDLAAYRAAVTAMRALPNSDPRSWARQAQIHEDHCPHRNWYFLPWHRAYLTAFEGICRQLSGKADFALPFWDWTVDRNLPQPFTSGTAASNPLHWPGREAGPADSLADEDVGPTVIDRILRAPDFEAFGSHRPRNQNSAELRWLRVPSTATELEGTPHNGVHVFVGGDMMSFLSPLDPIFWLHHCNVDRLWETWNESGRNNPTERHWLDMSLAGMFVDSGGQPYAPAVSALQRAGQLGYSYPGRVARLEVSPELLRRIETLRGNTGEILRNIGAGATAAQAIRSGGIDVGAINALGRNGFSIPQATALQPLSAPIPLGRPVADLLRLPGPTPAGTEIASSVPAQRAVVILDGIVPPDDRRTRLRVFVNCPYLSPRVPPTDRHYAGTVNFFLGGPGAHAGHGDGGLSQSIDLTPVLTRLYPEGRPSPDQLEVQLMPVLSVNRIGPDAKGTEVTVERVVVTIL